MRCCLKFRKLRSSQIEVRVHVLLRTDRKIENVENVENMNELKAVIVTISTTVWTSRTCTKDGEQIEHEFRRLQGDMRRLVRLTRA